MKFLSLFKGFYKFLIPDINVWFTNYEFFSCESYSSCLQHYYFYTIA